MLQIVDLNKKYGDFHSLKNLNLIVNSGEVFCLLGQNGAGKTTTINLCLGFIPPTSGYIKIDGEQVNDKSSSVSSKVAYIPEVVMLYGNLTGLENLDFFSRLAGFKYAKSQLESFLSEANLQKEAHAKRVGGYSKGMRQKVGIAIALAKNAKLIFMDEPTSGLDPKATDEFSKIVLRLGEQGKAVLMATHDIFNAVNIGTHIGIMKDGQLIHSLQNSDINPNQLQKLYLETI